MSRPDDTHRGATRHIPTDTAVEIEVFGRTLSGTVRDHAFDFSTGGLRTLLVVDCEPGSYRVPTESATRPASN